MTILLFLHNFFTVFKQRFSYFNIFVRIMLLQSVAFSLFCPHKKNFPENKTRQVHLSCTVTSEIFSPRVFVYNILCIFFCISALNSRSCSCPPLQRPVSKSFFYNFVDITNSTDSVRRVVIGADTVSIVLCQNSTTHNYTAVADITQSLDRSCHCTYCSRHQS